MAEPPAGLAPPRAPALRGCQPQKGARVSVGRVWPSPGGAGEGAEPAGDSSPRGGSCPAPAPLVWGLTPSWGLRHAASPAAPLAPRAQLSCRVPSCSPLSTRCHGHRWLCHPWSSWGAGGRGTVTVGGLPGWGVSCCLSAVSHRARPLQNVGAGTDPAGQGPRRGRIQAAGDTVALMRTTLGRPNKPQQLPSAEGPPSPAPLTEGLARALLSPQPPLDGVLHPLPLRAAHALGMALVSSLCRSQPSRVAGRRLRGAAVAIRRGFSMQLLLRS